MSYLLDKKEKRKKFLKILFLAAVLLVLFFFRAPISRGLSLAASFVFRPVLWAGGGVGGKFQSLGAYFSSKSSLSREHTSLKLELEDARARMSNYNVLLDENLKLKEILSRTPGEKFILATILAKPNRSPYDTLLIDVGSASELADRSDGVEAGDIVFAFGDIPIGKIAEVYAKTSKVILFSNPGERTEVLISGQNIFMSLVGRGGGNFEMTLPRDLVLDVGTEVHLPGLMPQVLATVETILSDPRDAYQKALLVSPVNIQELKFVEVEK